MKRARKERFVATTRLILDKNTLTISSNFSPLPLLSKSRKLFLNIGKKKKKIPSDLRIIYTVRIILLKIFITLLIFPFFFHYILFVRKEGGGGIIRPY